MKLSGFQSRINATSQWDCILFNPLCCVLLQAIKIDEFVGKDVDQNGFKIKLIDKESGKCFSIENSFFFCMDGQKNYKMKNLALQN